MGPLIKAWEFHLLFESCVVLSVPVGLILLILLILMTWNVLITVTLVAELIALLPVLFLK